MMYEDFIAHCQKGQREYIRDERTRYEKAYRLWNTFERDMLLLGLHPLVGAEISSRLLELEHMALEVPETHGDSVSMRSSYAMHYGEDAKA